MDFKSLVTESAPTSASLLANDSQWPGHVGLDEHAAARAAAEFHYELGRSLPRVTLSAWSACGGRRNEEEGQ